MVCQALVNEVHSPNLVFGSSIFFSSCLPNLQVYLSLYLSADSTPWVTHVTNDQKTQAAKDWILLRVGPKLKKKEIIVRYLGNSDIYYVREP